MDHHVTQEKTNQSGFTLIEIAMVIIIVSFLLIPLFALYSNYFVGKKLDDTQESLVEASSYISTYFSATSTYPCPADPTLPVTDPNYGIADCTASGIITASGARDAGNVVYIGMFPITTIRNTLLAAPGAKKTLILTDSSIKDGWNNRLTYAVTSSLTDLSTYKYFDGQIGAIDEFGNNTAGIDNDAHFAMISHGKNGAGGYSQYGTMVAPCPGAGSRENENCDGDAIFMSALGVYEGGGVNYFDDITSFSKSSGAKLWDTVSADKQHIYNLNTKNVGVNTATPTEKVEVSGTVAATNNVKVEKICTKDGSKCFDVKKISSATGMNCAGIKVMTGITNGGADCITPTYAVPVNVDCSPHWISSVRSDGCVVCTDGSVKC